MRIEATPVWLVFACTVILVLIAIEAGFRVGKVIQKRAEEERVPSVASVVGAILSLLAFMLAFTFGMVASRYDARKTLVREETNAIRTAWLRSDLLPETDRGESVRLLRDYVESRIAVTRATSFTAVGDAFEDVLRIHRRLWGLAVANADRERQSPVAVLYVEGINELIRLHTLRVAVGLQARIPVVIWLVLYALIVLSMVTVGFHIAITGSHRSWSTPLLAVSFSIVITLIASLDNPLNIAVSQGPLEDLLSQMDATLKSEQQAAPGGG